MGAIEDREIAKMIYTDDEPVRGALRRPEAKRKKPKDNGKPRVNLGNLLGPEGNVYCVLGRCQEAGRLAGWTKEQQDAFFTEATSDDYNQVLETVEKYFNAKMYPAGYRQ